ncbi:hypothetical protein, partial [Hydrocoleum sp. CS-953]|uniref:hypothetical protein n=1 Tax=Hydrocoleum sp. CS-953 TaxID=1671698 RepID=UPI001AEF73C5
MSDLLFDVNEAAKLPEFQNKNEWDFVTPANEDFSDLFDGTGENELQKNSKSKIQNTNSEQENNNQRKTTPDLTDLFGDLNNGDLSELDDVNDSEIDWELGMDLEANISQANINYTPQNKAENSQLDELDLSDLLAIQDVEQEIKSETKTEKSQLNTNTTNDLTSRGSDLEALFEDLEEIPVESEDLTSSLEELFDREDVDSSNSQDLINVEQLDWQDLTQNDNNDLNSLLDAESIDFTNLSAENTVESNDKIQENDETSADLEDLWPTLEEPKDNNGFNQDTDETLDLDLDLD